jgi:ADP-ribose pyrophosphatase
VKPDSRRLVYDGKQFDVVVERWDDRERDIVVHPGSVAVVAVDREGVVTLVRQTREAARKQLVELPAGTLDDGEDPLAAAKRELEEECGLRGGDWRRLGAFWTSPGFLNERMTLYAAEGVEPGGEQQLDDDEDVELVRWRLDELERRIDELEDAKTVAGLLLYLRSRAPS